MRKPKSVNKQNWMLALVFAIPFIGMKKAIKLAEDWA